MLNWSLSKPKATILDIAKRANVSIATVSAVINSSAYVNAPLRDRVAKAIKELDYHPNEIARSLKKKKTQTLGVVIPDITNPFFTSLVRGIEDVANRFRYTVILCNTDEDPEKESIYINALRSKRVDGIVIATAILTNRYSVNIKSLKSYGLPVVFVNRIPSSPDIDAILVDSYKGSYEAISYLAKLGHQRIGIVTGEPNRSTMLDRIRGYKEALRANRLRINNELIRAGNSRVDGGYQKGMELLGLRNRPSAIFATNNLMTIGVMKAILEEGLSCPEDVSVVGFDDFEWANVFRPRLTTVAQPTHEMGIKAAELLIRRIEGKGEGHPEKVILAPFFIVRDSCRKPTNKKDKHH